MRIFAASPLLKITIIWFCRELLSAAISHSKFNLFQHEALIVGMFLVPFSYCGYFTEFFYISVDAHSKVYALRSPVLVIFSKLSFDFHYFNCSIA